VNILLGFFIQQQPNQLMQFLPMVLIMVVFYFLLFLPMQRQKKQQKAMIDNLKSGDTVVTTGGIVGTVYRINNEDDTLVLQVKPDNIKLQVSRAAVSGLSGAGIAGVKKS
jgi:preprotein translocase subunit YajC